MKRQFEKIINKPVYLNILMVLGLFCVITYLVLKSIDRYTNHNQAVYVPDVRGLQIEEAEPFFKKNLLRYNVADSIYTKDAAPGAIVDLRPEAESKVKKNRIVYITINAKSEESAIVPILSDISFRQAYAMLTARGFSNVEHKYILGEYKDLTIGVVYEGDTVTPGSLVPLNARLTLLISDGEEEPETEEDLSTDSVVSAEEAVLIEEEDENWF